MWLFKIISITYLYIIVLKYTNIGHEIRVFIIIVNKVNNCFIKEQ